MNGNSFTFGNFDVFLPCRQFCGNCSGDAFMSSERETDIAARCLDAAEYYFDMISMWRLGWRVSRESPTWRDLAASNSSIVGDPHLH